MKYVPFYRLLAYPNIAIVAMLTLDRVTVWHDMFRNDTKQVTSCLFNLYKKSDCYGMYVKLQEVKLFYFRQ